MKQGNGRISRLLWSRGACLGIGLISVLGLSLAIVSWSLNAPLESPGPAASLATVPAGQAPNDSSANGRPGPGAAVLAKREGEPPASAEAQMPAWPQVPLEGPAAKQLVLRTL